MRHSTWCGSHGSTSSLKNWTLNTCIGHNNCALKFDKFNLHCSVCLIDLLQQKFNMSGLLSSLLLQQKYNMPGLLPSVLLISTTALLASFFVHLLSKYVVFKKSSSLRLPPGPRPWPVVGNLLQLSQGGENLHKTFMNWGKQYGPLVYLRLGSVHTVVASSPAMVKEFLKTHDQQFYYRPTQTMVGEIVFSSDGMAFMEGGPKWQYLRKFCMTELFSVKRLQSFEAMRTKEISSMINNIYMESEEGKVVNLNFQLTYHVNNIITQMLFGKRYLFNSNLYLSIPFFIFFSL